MLVTTTNSSTLTPAPPPTTRQPSPFPSRTNWRALMLNHMIHHSTRHLAVDPYPCCCLRRLRIAWTLPGSICGTSSPTVFRILAARLRSRYFSSKDMRLRTSSPGNASDRRAGSVAMSMLFLATRRDRDAEGIAKRALGRSANLAPRPPRPSATARGRRACDCAREHRGRLHRPQYPHGDNSTPTSEGLPQGPSARSSEERVAPSVPACQGIGRSAKDKRKARSTKARVSEYNGPEVKCPRDGREDYAARLGQPDSAFPEICRGTTLYTCWGYGSSGPLHRAYGRHSSKTIDSLTFYYIFSSFWSCASCSRHGIPASKQAIFPWGPPVPTWNPVIPCCPLQLGSGNPSMRTGAGDLGRLSHEFRITTDSTCHASSRATLVSPRLPEDDVDELLQLREALPQRRDTALIRELREGHDVQAYVVDAQHIYRLDLAASGPSMRAEVRRAPSPQLSSERLTGALSPERQTGVSWPSHETGGRRRIPCPNEATTQRRGFGTLGHAEGTARREYDEYTRGCVGVYSLGAVPIVNSTYYP